MKPVMTYPHTCAFQHLGAYIDQSGKVGEVAVEQCLHCGHARSLPRIPDVSFLYEGRDSQDYQPANRGVGHFVKAIAFRRGAQRLLKHIGQNPGRLIDFGCGSGQFTDELAKLLAPGQTAGADFFAEPPQPGLNFDYLPFATLAARQGSFDTVIAMHVLEHAEEPDLLLEQMVALVRPGGSLVVEVPNVNCVWARIFSRKWDAWYIPFHRQHFSQQSIEALFERTGLRILSRHGVRVPTMGRTLRNLAGARGELLWLFIGIVMHPIQVVGEWLTGQPSAIRIVAQRPSA